MKQIYRPMYCYKKARVVQIDLVDAAIERGLFTPVVITERSIKLMVVLDTLNHRHGADAKLHDSFD